MDIYLYRFLGSEINRALENFVLQSATHVITESVPFVLAGLTAYISILGIQTLMGGNMSFESYARHTARIAFVGAITGSYVEYDQYVVSFFQDLELWLISIIHMGNGRVLDSELDTSTTVSANNIFAVLDGVLSQATDLVSMAAREWSNTSTFDVGGKFMWTMIIVCVLVSAGFATLMGAVLMIAAKVAIAALLAVGPLFLICFMWPITSRFATLWITQLVNYTVQIFMVTVYLAFSVQIYYGFAENWSLDEAAGLDTVNPMVGAFQLVIISIAIYWLLKQTNSMASALSGGIGLASTNLGAIGRRLNPTSTRMDMQSGKQRSDTLLSHMVGGNTLLNKNYRSQVTSQLGRNWGSRGGSVSNNTPAQSSAPKLPRRLQS